jgi:hypothetical protein
MLGRGLVVLALLLAVGSSARAAPDDEIEMEPEVKPPAKPEPKPEPKPEATVDGEPVKDPKIAKKWLSAAQQLVAKGDALAKQKKPDDAKQQWENAIIAYTKALESGLDVVIWAELAGVEDKLGLLDAVKHYKLALAVPNLKPPVQKQLSAKLDELLAKVGLVTLTIVPDDTKVTIGDKELGTSPLKEPLVLAPGSYTVSFTATGYEPRQAELKVEAGSESERKIELEAKKPVIETVDKEPEAPPPAKPVTPMWPLYAGAGASGGLLLIGTVTGIVAVSKHGTFTSRTSTAAERRDAQSSGPRYAHITDVCLTGAVLAGAFTAYYYLYKYKPSLAKEAPPATSKLDLAPWVQPDAGGVAVGGQF